MYDWEYAINHATQNSWEFLAIYSILRLRFREKHYPGCKEPDQVMQEGDNSDLKRLTEYCFDNVISPNADDDVFKDDYIDAAAEKFAIEMNRALRRVNPEIPFATAQFRFWEEIAKDRLTDYKTQMLDLKHND